MSETGDAEQRARALSAALAKLPVHVGTVWRAADLSAAVTTYRVGDVVLERGFVSCTKDPRVTVPGRVTYVVASRSGHDLGGVSAEPGDEEVVLDRGAMLLVLAVDVPADTVFLAEVPAEVEPRHLDVTDAANRALLYDLQVEEDARRRLPPEQRRPARAPDRYTAPLGMDGQGRLLVVTAAPHPQP